MVCHNDQRKSMLSECLIPTGDTRHKWQILLNVAPTAGLVIQKQIGNRSRLALILKVVKVAATLGLVSAPAILAVWGYLKHRALTLYPETDSVVVNNRVRVRVPVAEDRVDDKTLWPCSQRIRRRARWVNILQDMLRGQCGIVGALRRRWWRPDLPTSGVPESVATAAHLALNGFKVLAMASRTYEVFEKDGLTDEMVRKTRTVQICNVQCETGNVYTILPELYCKLTSLCFGRTRDYATQLYLKSRYMEEVRELELPIPVAANALAGTVGLAFAPTNGEEAVKSDLARMGLSWDRSLA